MVLYKLFLFLYPKIASILAIFNQKASALVYWTTTGLERDSRSQGHLWIKDPLFGYTQLLMESLNKGLPIIEAIRATIPSVIKFGLTFFSPSGYLHSKE